MKLDILGIIIMSTKIATVSAVFAACEDLDKLQKPWNRDDVRSMIGGGGYNVIDPLIKAWRKLGPIKEVAPNTPTDLLLLVAEAIERNVGKFLSEVDSRQSEKKIIFDEAVNEISAKLSAIEQQLESSESRNEKLLGKNDEQAREIERLKLAIQQQSGHCETLATENDKLNGAVLRLNAKLKSDGEAFEKEISSKAERHKEQTENLLKMNKVEKDNLKTELVEQNVLAENRLMCLLDQSRTDAKTQQKDASKKVEAARIRAEEAGEKVAAMLSENTRLQSELSAQQQENRRILESITKKSARYTKLEEEYIAFKADNENSKFEELKASILAIEEKIKPDSL